MNSFEGIHPCRHRPGGGGNEVSVAGAEDAPGAAVMGMLLMVEEVVLSVWKARTEPASGLGCPPRLLWASPWQRSRHF